MVVALPLPLMPVSPVPLVQNTRTFGTDVDGAAIDGVNDITCWCRRWYQPRRYRPAR